MGMFLMTVSPLGRLSRLTCAPGGCAYPQLFWFAGIRNLDGLDCKTYELTLGNRKQKAMPRPIPTRNFGAWKSPVRNFASTAYPMPFPKFSLWIPRLAGSIAAKPGIFGNRTLLEMSFGRSRGCKAILVGKGRLTIPRLFRSSRTGLRSKVSPLAKNRIARHSSEADGIFR